MSKLAAVVALVSFLCLAGTGFAQAPSSKFSQPPSLTDSWQSQWDYNGNAPATARADDWVCADGLAINKLRWWGAEMFTSVNTPLTIDGFAIKIFDDLDSHPGNVLMEDFFTLGDITITDTGSTNQFGDTIYSYEVEFDQLFDQVQGEKYWLSIIAVTPDASSLQEWRWQEAIEGLNDSSALGDIIGNGPQDNPDINDLSWVYQDHDLAFELEVVPEPGTMALMSSGIAGLFLMIRRRKKN